MAYHGNNQKKRNQKILEVYQQVKKDHLPDTYIVRVEFPKYDIYISYRTWNNIKNMKPSELEITDLVPKAIIAV